MGPSRAVSDAFLRTVRGSHEVAVEARVVTSYQSGVDPVGTVLPDVGGAVTLDGSADVRSTLDLTTDGTDMWPTAANALLAPFGNEVFVRRGVKYGSGVTEWVSLGYFRVDSPSQDDPPDGPIRIEGVDRMQGIIDGRLTAPRQFTSITTYGQIVTALVTEVYPLATVQWDDTSDTQQVGRSLVVEEDRFAFLRDLVTSLGKIFYWDHRGILVIRTPPDATMPVFDVDAGPGGVLAKLTRKLTRQGVYNAVVATGEGADTQAPVRGIAVDNNPASPTYYAGRFGPVPRFFSSPMLVTNGQCRQAAESLLRQQSGLPYNVDFAMVPNVALEPFDPVRLDYSTRHAPEIHVLQTLDIPLTAEDSMSSTTREQSLVLIGTL